MTRPLAEIYDSIAENFAEAAIAIRIGPTTSPEPPEEALPDLPFTDTPVATSAPEKPHGSAAVCPAHGVEFVDGNFGLYCQQMSDDPEWSNAKGFCRITPKNAAIYMRKAVAAGKR